MESTDPATVIIPLELGTAAAFDQRVFPLAYYDDGGGDLSKGCLLIQATLDEMDKMCELGTDLLNAHDDFVFNTRVKLEALRVKKAKLQDNHKTLNPFKAFLNYRAARLFHAASKSLYLQTKRTSEKIHGENRHMQVVPSSQMRNANINDAVSPNATIRGISIGLRGELNDSTKKMLNNVQETMAKVTDPFQDNSLISQLRDGEQEVTLADSVLEAYDSEEGDREAVVSSDLDVSCPTSSQTVNHYHYHVIQDSIVITNSSNLSGVTANRGDRNSGASVTQEFIP